MNNLHVSQQQQDILDKLNAGVVLTSRTALLSIGVGALSQQVGRLINKGYPIRRTPTRPKNRHGDEVWITSYSIARENRE